MQTSIQNWERVVSEVIGKTPEKAVADHAEEIDVLWETFTQNRRRLHRNLLSERRFASAYLLGFHLPNLGRIQALWERAGVKLDPTRRYRLIELGCGTGAVSDWLASGPLQAATMKVHLVDNTKVLLQLAQSLMQSRRPFTHHCDIAEFRLPKIEKDEIIVLILSYTYNELHQNPRALNFIDRLCAKIREQESLIVFMDPANQLQAFQAMELRDSLAQKGWQILYPCPADTACPMLANKRDWCFSESEWRRPRVVVEVDRMLELNRSRFAYAGYIFSSIPRPDVSRPTRLVGLPRVGKDEQCRLVCKGTRIERKPMPRGVNPQSLLRCQPASEQS